MSRHVKLCDKQGTCAIHVDVPDYMCIKYGSHIMTKQLDSIYVHVPSMSMYLITYINV